jgi:protein disulfide-isomerase
MKYLLIAFAMSLSLCASAAEPPYNESADARSDIAAALVMADKHNVPVLVIFGANWCGDCKVLDQALKQGPAAELVAQAFQVVKVNVGRFDHNVVLADLYGVPLKKGIPAVAILSPQNKVLYVTQSGELADARTMGEQGLYKFFQQAASTHKPKS